jgi:hypothetical protein
MTPTRTHEDRGTGRRFFTLELLAGKNLREWLHERKQRREPEKEWLG